MNDLSSEFQARINHLEGWVDRLSEDASLGSVSDAEVVRFMSGLIATQRGRVGQLPAGGFMLVEDTRIPSDLVFDLILLPSYLATSIICLYVARYPDRVDEIPYIHHALKQSVDFCSLVVIEPHGYDGFMQTYQAIRILEEGGVIETVASGKIPSPRFHNAMRMMNRKFKSRLQQGRTQVGFQQKDRTAEMQEICEITNRFGAPVR